MSKLELILLFTINIYDAYPLTIANLQTNTDTAGREAKF